MALQHKDAFLHWQLVVFVVVCLLGSTVDAEAWVKLWNQLGPGKSVWVGCSQAVDEYFKPGTEIAPEATYYFGFHNDFSKSKTWWCIFREDGTSRHQQFVVWDRTRHSRVPINCHQCLWVIREDGFYIWDKINEDYKFYTGWVGAEQTTPREATHNDRLKVLPRLDNHSFKKNFQEQRHDPAFLVGEGQVVEGMKNQNIEADDKSLGSSQANSVGESQLYKPSYYKED